jgi:O-acetyl-ADP-ribose deacetylase
VRPSTACARSRFLISTGAYGYPIEAASAMALHTVRDQVASRPGAFAEIRFVLFSDADLRVYQAILAGLTS